MHREIRRPERGGDMLNPTRQPHQLPDGTWLIACWPAVVRGVRSPESSSPGRPGLIRRLIDHGLSESERKALEDEVRR